MSKIYGVSPSPTTLPTVISPKESGYFGIAKLVNTVGSAFFKHALFETTDAEKALKKWVEDNNKKKISFYIEAAAVAGACVVGGTLQCVALFPHAITQTIGNVSASVTSALTNIPSSVANGYRTGKDKQLTLEEIVRQNAKRKEEVDNDQTSKVFDQGHNLLTSYHSFVRS